jgi:predicted metal-binding protein
VTVDVLYVCDRCRVSRKVKEIDGERGGALLFHALEDRWASMRHSMKLVSVSCLSACDRHCAVAFQGRNKVTWIFGDLPVEPEDVGQSVDDLLRFSTDYAKSSDGFFERQDRPYLLQSGILARIPPLSLLQNKSGKISY